MERFLILLTIVLAGCGIDVSAPRQIALNEALQVDTQEFSVEDQEQMAFAMIAWDRATNGCVKLGWTDRNPVASVDYKLPLTDTAMARTFRTDETVRVAIKKQDWALPQNLQIVVAHEIGHALGIEHQESGLMVDETKNRSSRFSDDGVLIIDETTLEAFKAQRGTECK